MQHKIYSRWQKNKILEALKSRRVVILAGARQSGKTTLVRELASESLQHHPIIYRSLDDVTLLEAALSDPQGFVAHQNDLMIIDEIQRAPILLQAVKQAVDLNPEPGRFLLTGSANIQSLPNVRESLAGRVRKIRLRPLTEGELLSRQPDFITQAFTETFLDSTLTSSEGTKYYNKDDYLALAFRGGYPEIVHLEQQAIRRWHKDYLEALIERDLKDITNIKRSDSMQKLTEVLAAWSSKFMDLSAIGVHLSLTRPTLESYINALEALFLVERVRPWSKIDYARVSKRDKLFVTDTGLMTSILRWQIDNVRLDGEKNGKLIETFVFNQLSALLDVQDQDLSLFHYRDREKREIDFIVENENGDLLGIEVKGGSAIKNEHFKHLLWFKEKMANDKHFVGIVFYTGNHVASFGDGMWAVPISSLWA